MNTELYERWLKYNEKKVNFVLSLIIVAMNLLLAYKLVEISNENNKLKTEVLRMRSEMNMMDGFNYQENENSKKEFIY